MLIAILMEVFIGLVWVHAIRHRSPSVIDIMIVPTQLPLTWWTLTILALLELVFLQVFIGILHGGSRLQYL